MKHDEQALHAAAVNTVAALMAAAAKTAPKSCGADTLETVVLDGADKEDLADIMCELARETGMDFYRRDAENVRRSQCVVVIGAIASYMSTAHCGLCGMGNCGNAMRNNATCAFSGINLGIALGSAVGIAAAHHNGVEITYPDMEEWKTATESVYEDFYAEYEWGEELVQKILDCANS